MARDKTYHYDDAFKAKARAHQFRYKETVLKDFYEEKNPQVVLSPVASKQGKIFCDEYRSLICKHFKSFGTTALFSNMLRSEHIPYNVFIPMTADLVGTTQLFNRIVGGGIAEIKQIHIEFAGCGDRGRYLNDGTSFDVFVEYRCCDGRRGGIGIEVKYTEKGYRIGEKERKCIEEDDGAYREMTAKSGYYVPDLDISLFAKANHLRQIWRNHLLGYAMIERGDIQVFHHIHFYPQGNGHFHLYALPEYKKLLSEKGEKSFIGLTYEELFRLLPQYFKSPKQQCWIQYLNDRYLFDYESDC